MYKKIKNYVKKKILAKKVSDLPKQDVSSIYGTPPASPKTYSEPHTLPRSPKTRFVSHTSVSSSGTFSKPHTPVPSSGTYSKPHTSFDSPATYSATPTPSSSSENFPAREESQNENLSRRLGPNGNISGLEPFEIEMIARSSIARYKEWEKEAKRRRFRNNGNDKERYEGMLVKYINHLKKKDLHLESCTANISLIASNRTELRA